MKSSFGLLGLAALAWACAIGATACSDNLGLPAATESNVVDTVSLWALSDARLVLPSAYQIFPPPSVVRTDHSSAFDFAFTFDTLHRPVFLPTGALGLGIASGLQRQTAPFDSIKTAPGGAYVVDSALAFDSNAVIVVRSRPTTCFATVFYYAKLQVLTIDTVDHRVDFRILTDVSCGHRGLQPGVPRN